MKRVIACILCLLLILSLFTSCFKDKYEVEYPEIFTPEYCQQNYITADPNLCHLRAADNDIGPVEIPGGAGNYCAIKDIPIEDYLLFDTGILWTLVTYDIVKNKNNTELPMQEILSYNIKSIEIYSIINFREKKINERRIGIDRVKEKILSVDDDIGEAFQSHIIECLSTGDYFSDLNFMGDQIEYNGSAIRLRFVFEEYENLVWDTLILVKDDIYYIKFYTPWDDWEERPGEWETNWLPLNQELVELVAKLSD